MYEFIILAILLRTKSAHGYRIAKIINDMFGPYTKISNGRLYPLLAKLEEEKFIEQARPDEIQNCPKGERHSRSYKITEDGKKRFHKLMMDTTSNPGEYNRIFLHKASMLHFVSPQERLYLIDHFINYCQAHVLHITAERDDMKSVTYMDQTSTDAALNVMEHLMSQWNQELTWALHLRKQAVEELDRYKNSSDNLSTGVGPGS